MIEVSLPVPSVSRERTVIDSDFDVDKPASLVTVQITNRLPAELNSISTELPLPSMSSSGIPLPSESTVLSKSQVKLSWESSGSDAVAEKADCVHSSNLIYL